MYVVMDRNTERQLPITRARHELTLLPERLAADPGAIAITRRGEPVLALLPWELYESLVETLEVLADQDLMEALRQSLNEADSGELIPWETVESELDL
jgi:antitoxin YefM